MARPRTAPAPAAGAPPFLVLPVLFALSGAAALVFEVVWTRWLVLALGASSRAQTLVLAVFMGGLGVGAWLAGRLADRRAGRTVVLFAAAEAFVGAWGLLSILLVGQLLPALAAALARLTGATALPLPFRALLAVVALGPPTLLMGATLPLLARWVADAGIAPAGRVGALYTLNTLGGMAGALAAPFLLIDALGLSAAAAVAAGADLLVAVLAFALMGRNPVRAAPAPRGGPAAGPEAPGPDRLFVAVALAYFASGFVGLALEVVTSRVLAILAGSSVYAFAVMLAAFLAGIAGGSALVARFADRLRAPAAALGVALGALALGIGLAQRLFAGGGYAALGRWAALVPGLRGFSYAFELAGCVLTLLPATLALGAAVPLVARVADRARERFAGRFGIAYALNTGGAVLGASLAGLLLVPALGTARSSLLLVVIAGAAGIGVIAATGRALVPLVSGALLLAAGVALGWSADPVRNALAAQLGGRAPLAFVEGPVETIAVVADDNDQQLDFLRMITNRTSLTGTHLYARRYMSLLAHLPALWGPEPKRALVICYGTGMTAVAAASYPTIERLDIAEISPEVVQVAPLFATVNGNVLADSRVALHVEDGRHVMLASARPWDYITLEPPPPRDAGVVSLYSRDFYELARRRLSPGGVLAQWIPLHSQTELEIRMLVRSFLDAFPNVVGFLPVERDLLLLGSDRPLKVDPEEMARRMAPETVRASLAATGFHQPAELLATALLDRAGLAHYAGDAPLVTDDRPRVEYFARFGKKPGSLPDVSSLAAAPLDIDALTLASEPDTVRQQFRASRDALLALIRGVWAYDAGRATEGEQSLARAVQLRPHDPYYLWAAGISDAHLARMAAHAARGEGGPRAWVALAVRQAERRLYPDAVASLRQAMSAAPDDPETLFRLGALLAGPAGGREEGEQLLHRFLDVAPGHPAAGVARRILARPAGLPAVSSAPPIGEDAGP